MGLMEDLKNEAKIAGVNIQPPEAAELEKLFNKLFYAPRKPKEELQFLNEIFTRGTGNEERIGLHASAMIVSENEFCVRQQVLSLLYRQSQGNNIPINLKRIFEEGNAIHEKWQRLFIRGEIGDPFAMDHSRFVDKYELSYTPDAIITPFDEEMVVEIKSVNTYQFAKMDSHPSGAKQLQLYMRLTGIHKGIVLCDDKNTQAFKIFPVKYNPEVSDPFIERLEQVKYHKERVLTEGKMVARKKVCTSYMCKDALKCPMRDACFNRGMGRVRFEV